VYFILLLSKSSTLAQENFLAKLSSTKVDLFLRGDGANAKQLQAKKFQYCSQNV